MGNSIMVMVGILTKVSHLILVKEKYTTLDIGPLFIKDILRLHGLLKTINSDRGSKFTSKFWKKLHKEV